MVESPRTGAGQDAARLLASWGYRTTVLVDRVAKLDGFLLDDYAAIGTALVEADTSDPDAVVAAARHVAGGDLVGLTSVYEYFTWTAARAAEQLGLPGPASDAVAACRSKGSMRAAVARTAPHLNPRHAVVADADAAVAAAQRIGLPVVLKPVDLTGSVLVRRCDDFATVRRVAERIRGTATYLGVRLAQHVVVEEYLDGPEYSVETFAGRAVGVTSKSSGPLPYFVELAHRFPAPLDEAAERRVRSTAEDALAAVGLTWGPAHVEVKLAADGGPPRLVEVNARVGGDRVPELVRLATGIDLTALHMAAAVGLPAPKPTAARAPAAAVRFVEMPDKGRLEGVSGVAEAAAAPNVHEVHVKNVVGDVCFSHGSNRDRVAHVIATGRDADDALRHAERAAAALEFRWADVAGELEYV
ncbi:ATP-grasp domain-containing protein [Cellulomonas iranensis]|nr:ATP-grasp domain-containing protein [Cellulomonas iranensis]